MDDYTLWLLSRALALTSFAALAVSLLSGIALRTSVLDFLATNRALRRLHDFSTPLWLPLGAGHVVTIVLDNTARVTPLDVVVPGQLAYYDAYGQQAIALGTISFDLLAIVVVTSWLKRWLPVLVWRWLHRLSYPAAAALFAHALLAGTDFGTPLVSAAAWALASLCAVFGLARIAFGRLPA